MKNLSTILFFLLAFLSANSFAQQDGGLKVKNTDFKDLYNNYRARAVTPTPWAGSYWAYADDGIAVGGKDSPAKKYDTFFGQGNKATAWEKENHSCRKVEKEFKEGCENWWGHCDAWSSAAIKESEPRQPAKNGTTSFAVSDQKAYLTEIWMSSDSLFAGDTDKEKETKTWVCNPKDKSYDVFWDVVPRDFFLIFTNYIGIQNESLVIDRFTGDQVWNQPVVGYKISPLKHGDIGKPEKASGKDLYPVKLTTTIYWANDSVDFDYVSPEFNLEKADELLQSDTSFSTAYASRTLEFTLFFDQPVKLSGDQIASAGKIVGKGIWEKQQNCEKYSPNDLDDGHPDFIWRPTKIIKGEDSNPYIESKNVYQIVGGTGKGSSKPSGGDDEHELISSKVVIELSKGKLSPLKADLTASDIKRLIKKAFERAGISSRIDQREIEIGSKTVKIAATFPEGTQKDAIQGALQEAGMQIVSIASE